MVSAIPKELPPLRPIIKKIIEVTFRELGFNRRNGTFVIEHGIFESRLATCFRRPAPGLPNIFAGVSLTTDCEELQDKIFINRDAIRTKYPLLEVEPQLLVGNIETYKAHDVPSAIKCAEEISEELRLAIPPYLRELQSERDFVRMLERPGPFLRPIQRQRYVEILRGIAPQVDWSLPYNERFGLARDEPSG